MIRLTLLWLLIFWIGLLAWKDWYKAVCGLIILMAVIEHPDMPKTILGIQGLNPWNLLFLIVVLAWAINRGSEGGRFDMPQHIAILLLLYLFVVLLGFARMMARIQNEAPEGGNNAPESTQAGINTRFRTAWKPCTESIHQAMENPRLVSENAIRNRTSAAKNAWPSWM